MNKSRELVKNTLIIMLGRFCTQFISFLLVPLHTYYLLTTDYGYVDLVQTYIFLVAPIVILRFDSAIFRFLIDSRGNDQEIKSTVSSSIFLVLLLIFLLITIFIPFQLFYSFKYLHAALINVIFIALSSFLLQLTRGLGQNIDYSIASIISGIVTLIFNYILIVKAGYSAEAILYSSIIANVFCSIYLIIKCKLYKYLNLKSIDISLLKKMLHYSLPMIPDGLSWWIINVLDRIMISAFLGLTSNGVYAISGKLSNILSSVFQIFNMSWQESASLHIDKEDRDVFFSKVLNQAYKFFYSVCLLLLVSLPLVFNWFIGEKFNKAYFYVPPLLLGNLFNALANIIGAVYIAKKETKMVSRTTIIAAIINIIINLLFLKKFGLYIATFSTLISYAALSVYRYMDVQKYIKMELEWKFFIQSLFFFIVSSLIYFMNTFYLSLLNFIVSLSYLILINKGDLKNIIEKRRVK